MDTAGLSGPVAVAAVAAVFGGGGAVAWARWWGERKRPAAETQAVVVATYGDIIEDFREALTGARQEIEWLRAEVKDCEIHRTETERQLTIVKRELATLLEEKPKPSAPG